MNFVYVPVKPIQLQDLKWKSDGSGYLQNLKYNNVMYGGGDLMNLRDSAAAGDWSYGSGFNYGGLNQLQNLRDSAADSYWAF